MKIFTYLLALLLGSTAIGQISIVDTEGSLIPSGSMLEITGNASDAELEEIVWIVNEGSASIDLKCRRTEIDVLSGTTNNTCWVVCPISPFNAGQRDDLVSSFSGNHMIETMAQGDTAKSFALHYTPENLDGCSWFRVMWFTGEDQDDYLAYVDLKFNHATSCTIGVAGDIDGNGVINGSEIAGDLDNNGTIDNSEIAGDLDGNGAIDAGETAGDVDSDGMITGGELVGDINGNGSIDTGEELGDADGNGVIDGIEVGINEFEFAVNWSMYPNPANAQVTLELSTELSLKDVVNVEVVDLLGKQVDNKRVSGSKIMLDTESYNEGIYFVSLTKGETVIKTSKLIVKH